jgi:predicted phosphate transport protein (TIGR00153 family)
MGLFKKKEFFYESFVELAEYSLKSIETLANGLLNFKDTDLLKLKDSVHAIEHEADKRKRRIEEELASEFVTPIDREDIFVLLDKIDDLTDSVDEISYKLYIRNYTQLPPNIETFLTKAVSSIKGVLEVLKNFDKIKDKKVMDPLIDYVLNIEEDVDKLYEINVHNLYLNSSDKSKDYENIRMMERIYSYFEYVTDKSRDVCKEVLVIMYKNL